MSKTDYEYVPFTIGNETE